MQKNENEQIDEQPINQENGEAENETLQDPDTVVKNELSLLPFGEQAGVQKFAPNADIIRVNEITKKVKSFKKRFPPEKFVFKGVDDKAGEEKLAEARRELRKFRLAIVEELADKTKPLNDTVKFYNGKYKPSIDEIKKIELPLKELDEKHEKDKEDAKQAEAKALVLKVEDRTNRLKEAGAILEYGYYAIAEAEKFNIPPITLGIVDIQGMSDMAFENILRQVVDGTAIVAAENKKEEIRLKEEEDKRIADEIKAKQKLLDDQAEVLRQQNELAEQLAEMKRIRLESRGEQLSSLGFEYLKAAKIYKLGSSGIQEDILANTNSVEWNALFVNLKTKIEEDKAKAAEEERVKALLLSRTADLINIGMARTANGDFEYEELKFSSYWIKEATEEGWKEAVTETAEKIKSKKEEGEKLKTLISDRTNQLFEIGMAFHQSGKYFVYEDIFIEKAKIGEVSPNDWVNTVFETHKAINEKRDAAKKKIADQAIADQKLKEEAEEQERKENLAKAGDKAQWDYFTAILKSISFPLMESQSYRDKVEGVRNFINELK